MQSEKTMQNLIFTFILFLGLSLHCLGGPDNDDDQQEGHGHPDDDHHLHVLPPVLPLQLGGVKDNFMS